MQTKLLLLIETQKFWDKVHVRVKSFGQHRVGIAENSLSGCAEKGPANIDINNHTLGSLCCHAFTFDVAGLNIF